MPRKNSKIVTVGVVIILIIAAYLAYVWFFAGGGGAALSENGGVDASSPEVQNLLAFIDELKTIQVDSNIFSNPAFLSLRDTSVQIAPQPSGRRNPFAPF